MKVERLSYKKIQIVHTVPIYYRCGTFVSDKIGERKVREMCKVKEDNNYYRCGYKDRFFSSLSQSYAFKKKHIHVNHESLNFDFEGELRTFVITKNFFFDIDEEKLRDYKLESLLNENVDKK